MNAEAKMKVPTIRGKSVFDLPPKAVAGRYFQDGEGLESNPYPKGSDNYHAFMMEMGRLQYQEFKAEQRELRVGV